MDRQPFLSLCPPVPSPGFKATADSDTSGRTCWRRRRWPAWKNRRRSREVRWAGARWGTLAHRARLDLTVSPVRAQYGQRSGLSWIITVITHESLSVLWISCSAVLYKYLTSSCWTGSRRVKGHLSDHIGEELQDYASLWEYWSGKVTALCRIHQSTKDQNLTKASMVELLIGKF